MRRPLGNGEEGLSIPEIKTISSREVYRNKWTRVREDVIERASTGERGIYGVVDKDPACIIVPLESTPEGEFVHLVSQFRYTVGARYMELPQGSWEGANVDPEELARGELREETGLVAERMTLLATQQIGYGVLNQQQSIFLAEGLTQGEHDRDAEESDLEVHRVRVAEFEAMLLDGRIVDSCSAAAWGIYRLWRERNRASVLSQKFLL
jgi:8-oxo-dGTP pyrophosphatase MutT (NUDIX family)